MTVAQFLQTDYTSQTGTAYPLAIDADIAVFARLGDNFAPRPSSPAAMNVTLDSGHFATPSGGLTEVAAQTTGMIAAPATHPRIDRIVIDNSSGAVAVVGGVESASPAPPAIPAGKSPIAQALLQTTSTAIVGTMLTDERALGALGLASGAFTAVGTAAAQNVGTAAGNVVQLDGSARLPAVDGSQLTGLSAVPSGVVAPFAGSAAPSGWLLCYGQAVSRSSYAALLTAIGTTFGAGDGSTTFNIPDLRGRAAFGADAMGGSAANRLGSGATGGITGSASLGATGGEQKHTLTTAELPTSALTGVSDSSSTQQNSDGGGTNFTAVNSVSGSSSGTSGAAMNNTPPALVLNYIIKT